MDRRVFFIQLILPFFGFFLLSFTLLANYGDFFNTFNLVSILIWLTLFIPALIHSSYPKISWVLFAVEMLLVVSLCLLAIALFLLNSQSPGFWM
jgi:hypothetical protein